MVEGSILHCPPLYTEPNFVLYDWNSVMALLQPRLNLKVSQKQVLTPGLVQMVSLLALNKQELKEMIDAELLENPLLEEMEETVPLA